MNVCTQFPDAVTYQLQSALLVYTGDQRGFVTHHNVIVPNTGVPELGPGMLATEATLESLQILLGQSTKACFLPVNVLAQGPGSLIWWLPAARREMFFQEGTPLASLSGVRLQQPPLLFKATATKLQVYALWADDRPEPSTNLYQAPYWNLFNDHTVCLGTTPVPADPCNPASIIHWQIAFFGSTFTHAIGGYKITEHVGGTEGLWLNVRKTGRFPRNSLVKLPLSLRDIL